MESKINLEELILREFDNRTLLKDRLETKAVGCMAGITLMLGILFDFMDKLPSKETCEMFRSICFLFYIIPIIVGIILLIAFSVMLLPRVMYYFEADKLLEIYRYPQSDKISKEDHILNECGKFSKENEKVLKILLFFNKLISWGLLCETISFTIACIVFFCSIRG